MGWDGGRGRKENGKASRRFGDSSERQIDHLVPPTTLAAIKTKDVQFFSFRRRGVVLIHVCSLPKV